jgi:3-oxoacyl-(acyl-carrier-protein) synthase
VIRRDDADVMLAGSTDGITPLLVSAFCAASALSMKNDTPAEASRPFDRDRDGFVIAEGAGILILEELEYAKRRGANILCELAGYGLTNDAFMREEGAFDVLASGIRRPSLSIARSVLQPAPENAQEHHRAT